MKPIFPAAVLLLSMAGSPHLPPPTGADKNRRHLSAAGDGEAAGHRRRMDAAHQRSSRAERTIRRPGSECKQVEHMYAEEKTDDRSP